MLKFLQDFPKIRVFDVEKRTGKLALSSSIVLYFLKPKSSTNILTLCGNQKGLRNLPLTREHPPFYQKSPFQKTYVVLVEGVPSFQMSGYTPI